MVYVLLKWEGELVGGCDLYVKLGGEYVCGA